MLFMHNCLSWTKVIQSRKQKKETQVKNNTRLIIVILKDYQMPPLTQIREVLLINTEISSY